jgi:serine/threonine protein kinase
LKDNERVLQEHFPELLAECAKNRDLTLGSPLRNSIFDEGTSFDDYTIQKVLVADRVFVAYDQLRQGCVIKKLVGVREFKKEAERLWRLQHPLIVPISKVFLDKLQPDSICYIQMPYYEKGNLREWTKRMQSHVMENGNFDSQFAFVEVQQTFRQIAQALAHIHAKGIVHRDLKPENILLSSSGRLALCDFGISSDFGQAGSVATTIVAGTRGYMAPDIAEWRKNPVAIDMWSLGCMMFELLLLLLPQVVPSKFPPGANLTLLSRLEINSPSLWTTLTNHFTEPYMKGYVRLCSQLLSLTPELRPTASELLLDDALRVAVPAVDPRAGLNLIFHKLSSLRGGDTKILTVPSGEVQNICELLLREFGSLLDIHAPLRIYDQRGYERSLNEVMELFFEAMKLPAHGFFTQSLEATGYQHHVPAEEKAFLPIPQGNCAHFRTIGRMMAKCLLEGIRMPLQLNRACLEYLLGRQGCPNDVDTALGFLAETSNDDIVHYRNILRDRQRGDLEIGMLLGSDSEEFVSDANKTDVVTKSIWKKLVQSRRETLNSLREGLCELRMYEDLKMMTCRDVQMLFFGNEFVDLSDICESLCFTADTWADNRKMQQMRTWLVKWLSEVSDLTLRLLLLRCFGTYVFPNRKPRIFVVQSRDEKLHIASGGIVELPSSCGTFQSLSDLLRDELLLVRLKSDVERRIQVSEEEKRMIAQAMGSEIRVGGWYR